MQPCERCLQLSIHLWHTSMPSCSHADPPALTVRLSGIELLLSAAWTSKGLRKPPDLQPLPPWLCSDAGYIEHMQSGHTIPTLLAYGCIPHNESFNKNSQSCSWNSWCQTTCPLEWHFKLLRSNSSLTKHTEKIYLHLVSWQALVNTSFPPFPSPSLLLLSATETKKGYN